MHSLDKLRDLPHVQRVHLKCKTCTSSSGQKIKSPSDPSLSMEAARPPNTAEDTHSPSVDSLASIALQPSPWKKTWHFSGRIMTPSKIIPRSSISIPNIIFCFGETNAQSQYLILMDPAGCGGHAVMCMAVPERKSWHMSLRLYIVKINKVQRANTD